MILCEFGPDGGPCLFSDPDELIVAERPDEVAPALARLEARRRAGAWIAGWLSYELGYALEPVLAGLMPSGRRVPLMAFGVY
ncbi:MAG: aminodeoxychorismate synthase component I, partial [Paracoccus sp.]|nr:aminodeoxychorismate synthase component I [Paracoccus sp. (in: a-proteobacteria)]